MNTFLFKFEVILNSNYKDMFIYTIYSYNVCEIIYKMAYVQKNLFWCTENLVISDQKNNTNTR